MNHLSAIAGTTFLCDAFLHIEESLERRSNIIPTCIRAIKTWAKFESEKYVGKSAIGGANHMLSSYCYTIMSIAIFTQFNPKSVLDFMQMFFSYYSDFDSPR